jgi:sporulation protein YlmC with PRC-barrel domain
MLEFPVRDNAKYGERLQICDGETFLVKWHRREEVVGKEIIDGEAKKVGNVKDLAWSNDGKLAIVVERGREEESYLPFDQVEKIGDVVFIKSASGLESVPMRTCPVCKHKNLLDAKFCQKCGKTLEEKEKK